MFGLGFLGLSTLILKLEWHTYILPNKEVFEAIRRSKSAKTPTKLLIIGDSVAKQIFEESNNIDTVTSLACNQSIDLIGHYLLLKEFLSHNSQVERVVFIYNPFSFDNDLDHKFTYNYFLKPFYNKHYTADFTPHAKKQIAKIPFSKIVNFPIVAISFWTPEITPNKTKDIFLSETSLEYLQKIVEMTREKGIPLTLSAAPIKISRKKEVELLKESYLAKGNPLSILENYFENIQYLPDELYVDDIHFSDPKKIRATAEKEIYGRSN